MYRRMLSPIYRHFLHFAPHRPKSIHTNCNYFLNLEAALASQFDAMLQSCSDHSLIKQGRQVHSHAICSGLVKHRLVGTKLLGMYFHCASVVDAKNTFYQLDLQCAFPWNCMIRGFSIMGCFDFALLFYFKMLGAGVSPDKYTFPSVIKACGGLNNVRLGKAVYDSMQFMGFEVDIYAGSSLLRLYVNNGCIHDARHLFDKMPHKDCVLWNVMLHGYVIKGESNNAVGMFMEMRSSEVKVDAVTFSCILSVCASEAMISFGGQLHGLVVACGLESHFPVANTLVAMYSKCYCLSDARRLFDMMPRTDLVRWNGMISGYIQNGFMSDASHLFQEMISVGVKPDSITLASFLPSVAEPANLKQAKEIHGYIVRHCIPFDVFMNSALIDVYSKCESVEMARKIFNQSTRIDVVMCTAMVSGLVLNGMNTDALDIFRWLLREKMRPNSLTMASVLPACAGLAALKLGKELHGNIIKHGLDKSFHVGSALTGMYAKSGRLDLAHQVFQRLSERDAICWNSMLTSYSQNGKPEEAIDLFHQMGMGGAKYDCVSISAVLSACANLPALHYGKEIHGFMIKTEFSSDIFAESALIDMYAKCGNLVLAHRVFDIMEEKNEVSWNSIISAYGYHGRLKDSLVLFRDMLDNGILPDHVTFLGVLSACVHAGLVDDGILYFHRMTEEYGIPAWSEHYALMVDLFGRAGRLYEAFETIKSMPFSPGSGVWGTLLGSCRVHGNIELAEEASRHLFDLEPQNSGYYMLLANIYADAGQWENVRKVRNLMKERGVQKIPGYSWIEVNNKTHVFVAADRSHPQSAKLHSLLNILLLELRKEVKNALAVESIGELFRLLVDQVKIVKKASMLTEDTKVMGHTSKMSSGSNIIENSYCSTSVNAEARKSLHNFFVLIMEPLLLQINGYLDTKLEVGPALLHVHSTLKSVNNVLSAFMHEKVYVRTEDTSDGACLNFLKKVYNIITSLSSNLILLLKHGVVDSIYMGALTSVASEVLSAVGYLLEIEYEVIENDLVSLWLMILSYLAIGISLVDFPNGCSLSFKITDIGCQLITLYSQLRQVNSVIFALCKALRLLNLLNSDGEINYTRFVIPLNCKAYAQSVEQLLCAQEFKIAIQTAMKFMPEDKT